MLRLKRKKSLIKSFENTDKFREMREIKFRAWDKAHHKMCYNVNLYQLGDKPVSMLQLDNKSFMNDVGLNCELMQFTNLKDKNGKEIYEGDILKSTRDERLFNWKVVFENGCFGICNIGIDGLIGDFYPISSSSYFCDREVIGNIHENPELLK